MSYREIVRLGWALLASLLLHLFVVIDITQLRLSLLTAPASLVPPLEIYLPPLSSDKPIPSSLPQRHPSAQALHEFRASPDVPAPLPLPANVVSADTSAVPPEPTLTTPVLNPPIALAEETDAAIQRLPQSGKLIYRFYWGRARWLAGQAINEWVVKDGFYTLSSTVSTTGLFSLLHPTHLVETATGLVIGDKLRPLQFITQFNDYPPALAMFNWEKGHFRWFRGKSSAQQDLPANAYDKISFLYQLYLAREKKGLSSAFITTGRDLVLYEIENLGFVELEIDGRIMPTLHLRKIASSADSNVINVWLSTADNLPLKITYLTAAGDYFEQLISQESMPAESGANVGAITEDRESSSPR
jgi:hypothetical protein